MSRPGSESVDKQLDQLRTEVRQLQDLARQQGLLLHALLDERRPSHAASAVPPSRMEPAAAGSPTFEPPSATAYGDLSANHAPREPWTEPPLEAGHPAAEFTPLETRVGLETRIGSQWFNRIGILAVLIGMAWFLKYAIDNHWIGPAGRVIIGLLVGAALLLWSERFRLQGFLAFSYSLNALGSGIFYLSLWAAFSVFHLVPAWAAFAAMVAVTAFNGFLSWARNAELFALYGIVGGLSTPWLLSTGENHQIALFGFLLMLDCAVLLLVALRPWSRLLFLAFAGTVVYFASWWFGYYSDSQRAPTAFFAAAFFLLFAASPRLAQSPDPEARTDSPWEFLSAVLLPIGNAVAGFSVCCALASWPGAEATHPWLAAAFAGFYLLLIRLPAAGRWRANSDRLRDIHLATAVVFLSIAIPLKAHGRAVTVGWLVEGAALFWVSSRSRLPLLRVLAVLCLALGIAALVVVNLPVSTTPILNQRFGASCVAIAACLFAAWVCSGRKADVDQDSVLPWSALEALFLLVGNALILLAIGWEIDNFWWHARWVGDSDLLHDYQMYAQFTYSAWFMGFGAMLLAIGFLRRSAFFRWQALLLLAVAIGKVFLYDVSQLSQGYRILSFLGLGGLLLAVSFVYQRDLLRLRNPQVDSPAAQEGLTGPDHEKSGHGMAS